MSSPESNWHAWVNKAEHDRLNIRNNLAAQEVPWDTVCFHAQQVAEKMLKAHLVVHGVQPPKIHDLMALLEECLAHDALLDELRSPCLLLNAYPVVIRYPEPFRGSRTHSKFALRRTPKAATATGSMWSPRK